MQGQYWDNPGIPLEQSRENSVHVHAFFFFSGPKCLPVSPETSWRRRNRAHLLENSLIRFPCATKRLNARKISTRILVLIALTRFELFQKQSWKMTRYLLSLCGLRDTPRLGPLSLSNYILLPLPDFMFFFLFESIGNVFAADGTPPSAAAQNVGYSWRET